MKAGHLKPSRRLSCDKTPSEKSYHSIIDKASRQAQRQGRPSAAQARASTSKKHSTSDQGCTSTIDKASRQAQRQGSSSATQASASTNTEADIAAHQQASALSRRQLQAIKGSARSTIAYTPFTQEGRHLRREGRLSLTQQQLCLTGARLHQAWCLTGARLPQA